MGAEGQTKTIPEFEVEMRIVDNIAPLLFHHLKDVSRRLDDDEREIGWAFLRDDCLFACDLVAYQNIL
jgi:hypothetical protein